MSEAVQSEGSLRLLTQREGIEAGVTLYFVFDGDWSNVYDDVPATEAEARQWFVREVQIALERQTNEARQDDQAERPSDSENRGDQ